MKQVDVIYSNKSSSGLRKFWKNYGTGLCFLAPAMLFIILFAMYPILDTFINSFFRYSLVSVLPKKFIGFENYKRLIQDHTMVNSILLTLYYSLLTSIVLIFIGTVLAFLLNKESFIIRIFRGFSIMPMLICGAAVTSIWLFMFNSNSGAINEYLQLFFHIKGPGWLSDSHLALYSLMIVEVWQFTPFVMILCIAGLNTIGPELYEAAEIDGASGLQRIIYIALPHIKNVLIMIFIIRFIDSFKTFEKPFLLTNGGPLFSTETVNYYVYQLAFKNWNIGLGSAGAVIAVVITGALAVLMIKLTKTKEEG